MQSETVDAVERCHRMLHRYYPESANPAYPGEARSSPIEVLVRVGSLRSFHMLAILRCVLLLYRIGEGVNEVPYEDSRPYGVNGQAVSRRITIWPKWTMGLP